VPQHQNAPQLRSARHGRRDPRRRDPIRPQAERLQQTVAGQRGGLHAGRGRRGERRQHPARVALHKCSPARPRDRSRESARTLTPALRPRL
ncbi:MAG: COGs COG0840, partial [uncultured Thermomicrobiales bacterium]